MDVCAVHIVDIFWIKEYFKICVYNCYHIFGYWNNSNTNSNIFMAFPSSYPGH